MKSLAASVLAFTLVGAAIAQPIGIDVPTDLEPASSTVTRAEVAADFHMWRLAGLEDLSRGERSVDTSSYAYRRAHAIYVHLRASPQYAALVDRLQDDLYASVRANRPGERTVTAAK